MIDKMLLVDQYLCFSVCDRHTTTMTLGREQETESEPPGDQVSLQSL